MDHIFWNHDKVLKTFDKPVCDQWSGYDDEGFKSHVTAETALVKVPESHRLRTSFVWSRSLTKICSCLFRLLSLHSHCHVNQLRRLLVWLMFTVSDLLSEVKKKLNNDGVFFSSEPQPVNAELSPSNFNAALPLSGLFIPPCWAPLEETGRWTSAHGKQVPPGTIEAPPIPHTLLFSPTPSAALLSQM